MRFEIPVCKRCCFCVPLRYGVLILGYFNLIITLLIMSLEAWIDFGDSLSSEITTIYRGVGIYTQLWLPYLLYSLECIFNIVLLVGAHTKRTRLIRVYYYYGIMTTLAACLIFLVVRHGNRYQDFYFDFLDFSLVFSGFVIQAYLLLLIRSELQKLKYQQGQIIYVNHMSEVLLNPPTCDDGRNPV